MTSRAREQFEFERQLRDRILASPPADRARVVADAYGALFHSFPDHAVFQETDESRRALGRKHAALIAPWTRPGQRVLEVGCGRGDVVRALQETGVSCVGLEPSAHMLELCRKDGDLDVRLGTADHLPFDDATFDLVFSQQVLEHLHPSDVPLHLRDARRVLKSGGLLVIETPNQHTGPQDISRGFTRTAEGLHLKEWSVRLLSEELRRAGFRRVHGLLAPSFLARRSPVLHRWTRVPAIVKRIEEECLALVPGRLSLRTFVARAIGLHDVLLAGVKE